MGHGWVTPNPGGFRVCCGGPAECPACAIELAHLRGETVEIQLFTARGDLVATVEVKLEDQRVPDSVSWMGRIFARVNGRYVELNVVPARQVAA